MLWEESNRAATGTTPDMIDVSFRLKARRLSVNHHHALAHRVCQQLPWLRWEPWAGIHPIRIAPSAHGWSTPQGGDGGAWHLAKRTRLRLRIPSHREADVSLLEGSVLELEPETIEIGPMKTHRLTPADPLFAKHVVSERDVSEPRFVDWIIGALKPWGIHPKKVLCGKWDRIITPEETLHTRSVLLASLTQEASIRLQCRGLGRARELGCGIFVPHKSIEAVRNGDQQS